MESRRMELGVCRVLYRILWYMVYIGGVELEGGSVGGGGGWRRGGMEERGRGRGVGGGRG